MLDKKIDASEIRRLVAKCNLCTNRAGKFYHACEGNLKTAKLMVIGQAPSNPINQITYPFDWRNQIGDKSPSARLIDAAFSIAKIKKSECYVTNFIKCAFNNIEEYKEAAIDCVNIIEKEIANFGGKYILILSKMVCTFFNIHTYEFKTIYDKIVYGMNHPMFYYRNKKKLEFIKSIEDFWENKDKIKFSYIGTKQKYKQKRL